ncbi:AI-2E family transporter, partial [Komagataeibacter xylinus]
MAKPPQDGAGRSADFTRAVLVALLASLIVISAIWILRPFLPATIWAVTIGVTTWPPLLRLQAVLGHSRGLAVSVTILIALLIFVLPLWLAITTVVRHAGDLAQMIASASTFHLPAEPDWLRRLPLIGQHTTAMWTRLQHMKPPEVVGQIIPSPEYLIRSVLSYAGSFSMLAVQFLLTLVILGVLLMKAEAATAAADRLVTALAGERGREMLLLAGHTIRGVAFGVTVTAIVESAVAGLGLKIAVVPLASILTAVTFMACLLQAGPGITLIPAVIWVYFDRGLVPALILLVITVVTIVIDADFSHLRQFRVI